MNYITKITKSTYIHRKESRHHKEMDRSSSGLEPDLCPAGHLLRRSPARVSRARRSPVKRASPSWQVNRIMLQWLKPSFSFVCYFAVTQNLGLIQKWTQVYALGAPAGSFSLSRFKKRDICGVALTFFTVKVFSYCFQLCFRRILFVCMTYSNWFYPIYYCIDYLLSERL